MFKQVNSNELIPGQKYIITNLTFKYIAQFSMYGVNDEYVYFSIPGSYGYLTLFKHTLFFYTDVSKEEYYHKLKEKYDQTCLKIVLKYLINDDFEWK